MRNMLYCWIVGTALSLGLVGAALGEVVLNDRFPFSQTAFVPCAAGGLGELLVISGTLHLQIHETIDGSGGRHFGITLNAIGATGVGLETGTLYRANGGNREISNVGAEGLPFSGTYVNVFNLIGTAGGESLRVHNTIHFTVTPNGTLTAEVDNSSVDCQ